MAPGRLRGRWLALLLALWIVLYVVGLGALDIQGSLEGLRVVVARTMLHSGDWVVPSFAGRPYLLKPPLVNWEIATSGVLLGDLGPFAARLPSALAVLATALLLAWWGRRQGAARAGRAAAVLYLFLPLVFEKGIRAEIESSLALFVAWGLLAAHEATRGRRGDRRPADAVRWTAVAAAGIALGFLAKGPPAPFIALASLVPWLAWRGVRVLSPHGVLAGSLVAAALVGLWVVPLVRTVGWHELVATIDVEVLQRVRAADPGNREGVFYYVPRLLGGALPAFLFIPGIRRSAVAARHAPSLLFLALWVAGPLLALSAVSGKESRYLLPLYPALALLAGFGVEALLEKRPAWVAKLPRAAVGLLLLAVAVKTVWLLGVVPHKNARRSPQPLARAVEAHLDDEIPLTFIGTPRAQLIYYMPPSMRHADDVDAWLAGGVTPPQALLVPWTDDDAVTTQKIGSALPAASVRDLAWGTQPYRFWIAR